VGFTLGDPTTQFFEKEIPMKVTAITDEKGHIVALAKKPDQGKVTWKLRALAKQHLHELDLPAEFEHEKLSSLHNKLRVEGSGHSARFVKFSH
jgi:hypothetical protein